VTDQTELDFFFHVALQFTHRSV